jgi:hypothetical protein
LNGFLLQVRGEFPCNLLCKALGRGENIGGDLLAHAELITLNSEHSDPLRQAIQNLAKPKSLRQSESMTRKMCSVRQLWRTAFPYVYRACGSTRSNRINEDEVLLIVPTRNEFEGSATLNLRWNSYLAQALSNQNSSTVVHALQIATPYDSSLHLSSRLTVNFKKSVAQEMQGS